MAYPDIVAEIAAAIPAVPPGNRPWWQRAAPEHAETLAAIHAAWHAGAFGSRKITAARVIASRLGGLGIRIGEQGVMNWLDMPKQS